MSYLDDLLEGCLNDLERGLPLEKVVQRVPADAAEILPLLRLAAVTRELPHPSMATSKARAQRGQVMKLARSYAQPERRFSLRFAMAQMAMVAVLLVVGLVTVGLTGPAGSRYATLMDVDGVVEVFDGQNWQLAAEGGRVNAGQLVRTRMDSQATLVFYEGTRSALEEGTQLTLESVRGGWNRSLQVVMNQTNGFSSHSVVPLKGASSRFIVKAAQGQAAVHGTVFDVEVMGGASRFAVTRGVVEVTYAQEQVMLTAGQATLVQESGLLDEPSYEFNVQGPIETIEGDTWAVGGLSFFVDPALTAGTDWQVGDLVRVRGRILGDGSLAADWIKWAANDKEKAHFTGLIESTGADAWVIGGKTVLIDGNTEIEAGLGEGDPVEVSFVVLEDGSWLALEIQSLDEDLPEETETPTVGEPTPEQTETGTQTPTQTLTQTVTPTPQATPTLPKAGCGVGDNEQPEGAMLAERYGVEYAEIMNWFCQGYGFGEIDLAYEMSLNTGIPVEDIFAMRESGMGWGTIKQTMEPKITKTPKVTSTPRPTREDRPTKEPKEEKPTREPNPNKP